MVTKIKKLAISVGQYKVRTSLQCGRVRVTFVPMETHQYLPFFIVVGVGVAVSTKNVFIVDAGTQQWVVFALLSSYKIFW